MVTMHPGPGNQQGQTHRVVGYGYAQTPVPTQITNTHRGARSCQASKTAASMRTASAASRVRQLVGGEGNSTMLKRRGLPSTLAALPALAQRAKHKLATRCSRIAEYSDREQSFDLADLVDASMEWDNAMSECDPNLKPVFCSALEASKLYAPLPALPLASKTIMLFCAFPTHTHSQRTHSQRRQV